MVKINTYSAKGTAGQSMTFPKELIEKENMTLLTQAIRVYEDRSHTGVSKTKTRGEITARKGKVWKQKGTGRARHGARSAPIFVGGGKAHGPKSEKRTLNLPKKMKRKAYKIALTRLVNAGRVVVVNGINFKKTKEAEVLIEKIVKKEFKKDLPNKILVALDTKNMEAKRAFSNVENVKFSNYQTLNAYKLFFTDLLIIDKEVFSVKKEVKKTVKTK